MRVLFVDDQPEILAALRRMLRGLRHEWQMEFVQTGDQALARMAESPFDVVVSDMRMPGMDGTELLTKTMERHPATVRIILSGHADEASVLRAVTPAHQYLAKPCDADTLKSTLARACTLREALHHESLIRLVSQITTLPSLPHVYTKLLEELQSEDASVQAVAELIAQDISMTAKLMQMVNSSFFGIPRRVASPAQAAALLGLKVLKPLVLSAGIFSQFRADTFQAFSADGLMEHSLAVSCLAEKIACGHTDDATLAEDALLAGLLHDVGQLLLVENLQEQYGETLALLHDDEMTLCEAEVQCLGANHADVGAYLLGLWGMSDRIVEAVAFHHHPMSCTADGFGPLTAVHVANGLTNEIQRSCGIMNGVDMDMAYLERLGVAGQLPSWRETAENFYVERAELS